MNHRSLLARIKAFVILLGLLIIDIGPVPVTALLAMYVVLFRPNWFKTLIWRIYAVHPVRREE